MNNVYFTADLHLGHRNIIKYLSRPFMNEHEKEALKKADGRSEVKKVRISNDTINLHDQSIIENINNMVGENDTLYCLGDFCMGRFEQVEEYRERIACKNVYLIKGNHDKLRVSEYQRVFTGVKDLHTLKWNGQKIVLCHYPMMRWDTAHYGSWHLYGHCHGTLVDFLIEKDLEDMMMMDVGVDCNGYNPVSFDAVKRVMSYKNSM